MTWDLTCDLIPPGLCWGCLVFWTEAVAAAASSQTQSPSRTRGGSATRAQVLRYFVSVISEIIRQGFHDCFLLFNVQFNGISVCACKDRERVL